ncbi:MAG: cadherin-like beta sandwich domain-containing protein [Bacilli bacterium]
MKLKYQIFLLLLLFVIPLNHVFASTDLYVNCPNGAVVGGTVDCELFATSDIEISAVRTQVSVSNNLEFVSFTTHSSWQGTGDNGDIALYTYPNQIGEIRLGIVTVKIKESNSNRTGTLYFKDVYFYKADFSGVSGTSIAKNIKILSTNNDLASLSLIDYDITPKFHKDVTEYRATVDSNIVVIEASPKDEFATVSGVGKKELNYGDNTFIITVISENGSRREYKLIITRPNERKEEINSSEDVPFSPNAGTNNNHEDHLEQGKDKDSRLRSLELDGYDIDFNQDMYRYYVNISSDIDELIIRASPSSDKANVMIEGNQQLVFGTNEITITVVAEDGSKSVYIIYVTKKSDVCVVKNIKVLNYDLGFDCNQYDYELEIGIEDSLDIDVVPSSDQSEVYIYHNDNLQNDDVVTIVVRVHDIDYKYHIKIVKNSFELENIVNNQQFIFFVFVIILALLYFVGRFLVKKRISDEPKVEK